MIELKLEDGNLNTIEKLLEVLSKYNLKLQAIANETAWNVIEDDKKVGQIRFKRLHKANINKKTTDKYGFVVDINSAKICLNFTKTTNIDSIPIKVKGNLEEEIYINICFDNNIPSMELLISNEERISLTLYYSELCASVEKFKDNIFFQIKYFDTNEYLDGRNIVFSSVNGIARKSKATDITIQENGLYSKSCTVSEVNKEFISSNRMKVEEKELIIKDELETVVEKNYHECVNQVMGYIGDKLEISFPEIKKLLCESILNLDDTIQRIFFQDIAEQSQRGVLNNKRSRIHE